MKERLGGNTGEHLRLEHRLPPEDGGRLMEYLSSPLTLSQPTSYYLFAANVDRGGRIIPYQPIRN
jgi:hypothetical protein